MTVWSLVFITRLKAWSWKPVDCDIGDDKAKSRADPV
jgi:hypothetical protein